ncbi:unnamed protein product, partial [Brenthis ino]
MLVNTGKVLVNAVGLIASKVGCPFVYYAGETQAAGGRRPRPLTRAGSATLPDTVAPRLCACSPVQRAPCTPRSSSSDNDISSIGDYVNENHILETKDTASCGTDKEVGDAKVTPDLNNEISDDEFFDVDPPDVHEPVGNTQSQDNRRYPIRTSRKTINYKE